MPETISFCSQVCSESQTIIMANENRTEKQKQTVLVTGSSGCLGQHVVRLLHERDDDVGEIRCFDRKPFSNNLSM